MSGSSKKNEKQASHIDSEQKPESTSKGSADTPPFNGHFLIGCFQDNSPKEVRLEYDASVSKKEKQKMSADVCFEFCKTQPNVEFFALYEGRKCYCAPYFSRGKEAAEQCDEPCEGGAGEMCGGKRKVSAYEMHRN